MIVGYSRGLFCLAAGNGMLVLWNPSIRRSVGILGHVYTFDLFGFACSEPRGLTRIDTGLQQVVIGSCIYRIGCAPICLPDGSVRVQYFILSFDLVSKQFRAVDFPDKITNTSTFPSRYVLSKLKGSLFVIVPLITEIKVWKMEPDCSLTQLFTIRANQYELSNIEGFTMNGELVVKPPTLRGWQFRYYKETLLLLDHPDSYVYPEVN
ncbi:hypothetical protein Tco_0966159 [Tanacetum coccineum]